MENIDDDIVLAGPAKSCIPATIISWSTIMNIFEKMIAEQEEEESLEHRDQASSSSLSPQTLLSTTSTSHHHPTSTTSSFKANSEAVHSNTTIHPTTAIPEAAVVLRDSSLFCSEICSYLDKKSLLMMMKDEKEERSTIFKELPNYFCRLHGESIIVSKIPRPYAGASERQKVSTHKQPQRATGKEEEEEQEVLDQQHPRPLGAGDLSLRKRRREDDDEADINKKEDSIDDTTTVFSVEEEEAKKDSDSLKSNKARSTASTTASNKKNGISSLTDSNYMLLLLDRFDEGKRGELAIDCPEEFSSWRQRNPFLHPWSCTLCKIAANGQEICTRCKGIQDWEFMHNECRNCGGRFCELCEHGGLLSCPGCNEPCYCRSCYEKLLLSRNRASRIFCNYCFTWVCDICIVSCRGCRGTFCCSKEECIEDHLCVNNTSHAIKKRIAELSKEKKKANVKEETNFGGQQQP